MIKLKVTNKKYENIIIFGSIIILMLIFTAQALIVSKASIEFFDNLHWTLELIAAVVMALIGVSKCIDNNRIARLYFFWGLVSFLIGQILWDIQVFIGWNPFPGPSDLGYLIFPIICLLGMVKTMLILLQKKSFVVPILDTTIWCIAILAVVLAIYLPMALNSRLFELIVLTAYPVAMMTAFSFGILMILNVRPKFHWSWIAFQLGLFLEGLLWMAWNLQALSSTTVDGSNLNKLFSVSTIILGISAMHWQMSPSGNSAYEKWCEGILRMLPLGAVILAAIASIIVLEVNNILPIVKDAILLAAFVVIILASVRQAFTLKERMQLLRAEKQVSESRELLQTVIDTIPLRVFWKNQNLEYIGCNLAFAKDAGLEKSSDLIGKNDYQMGWSDQAQIYRADDCAVMDLGIPKLSFVEPQTTPSGENIWIRTSKVPLKNEWNESLGILGVYEDITEQVVAESKIKRLSLLYNALSQCNQAIVRCDNKEELFPQICRDVVTFGGIDMAWIGLVDKMNQQVNVISSYGDEDSYLTGIHLSAMPESPYGNGPVGHAIRQNQAIWCHDFIKDSSTLAWRDRGETSKWSSIACLPLRCNGVVVGVFSLYSKIHNTFDDDIQNLLLEMANDISFALDNFSRESERKFSEANLRIAAISFESQEAIFVTDVNRIILKVNDAFTLITGYEAEEVIGQTPRILKSGRHDESFYLSMLKSIQDTGSWKGELWNRRKNGEIYPQYLTISSVKDSNGTVTNYVATSTDISQRIAAESEIHKLAFYDPLTSLPNRRLLIDRLKNAITTCARTKYQSALLFLDLDHFKALNDTLGHHIGDLLLQKVSRRLLSAVREGDTVARFGGDEYVIILECLGKSDIETATIAKEISYHIIDKINIPSRLDSHDYHNSVSIGITLFDGNESSVAELLKQADIAMYQAKKAGRNTLSFFDTKMQQAINERVSLERELRKALELNQFHLYYQIQVDDSENPLGAEALIRWVHPERGLISPFHFIPLAEETGQIIPIGQWVLETACAQIKKWEQNKITQDLTLSINVSAKQFHQTNFVDQVKDVLLSSGINPMKLKLELTESMLLQNIEETIIKMNILKDAGISFSLDDFGTGYSSLQYLKRLPLAQLKIDQSFVRDIANDTSDQEIVRMIIAMAITLRLDVIAEGVEDTDQKILLLHSGCMHYQGYLFGKPLPIDEFETALQKALLF